MDLQAELNQLRERSLALQDTIEDMDYQIEKIMHAVADGSSFTGHAMLALSERHNAQLGLMFDFGKITAQIEDLEQRIHEHDERSREQGVVEGWEEQVSPTEDRLDWLRPILEERNAEPTQDDRPHHEGEERILEDMQSEGQEPEDDRDWWRR